MESSNGLKEAKVLKGVSHSEKSKRVIGYQAKRPSEPDAVEAHGLDSLGNLIHRLFAKSLGHHSIKMVPASPFSHLGSQSTGNLC